MNKNMHIKVLSNSTENVWICYSKVWISKKTKTLSEMQDRPTTTHYCTSSSTNKQDTMGFLNKQCFFQLLHSTKQTYKPNKKDIYNHKEIDINSHKQKSEGGWLKNNSMQLFVKWALTKRTIGVSSAVWTRTEGANGAGWWNKTATVLDWE